MKPTLALFRRVRYFKLTTKQGPKDYYKGNRTGRMGDHTRRGGYIVDYDRVRTYVVPDLTGFKLTPFVTKKILPSRGMYGSRENDPRTGTAYLKRWKSENGED